MEIELMPTADLLATFYGDTTIDLLRAREGSVTDVLREARGGYGADFGSYALACAAELLRRATAEQLTRNRSLRRRQYATSSLPTSWAVSTSPSLSSASMPRTGSSIPPSSFAAR